MENAGAAAGADGHFRAAGRILFRGGRLEYTQSPGTERGASHRAGAGAKKFLGLEQQTLYGYPWNKIYDLSYLRKLGLKFLDYRENKFVEDILFNIEYCMDIDSLHLLP